MIDADIAVAASEDGSTGCVLITAARVLGQHANVTSLTLQRFMPRSRLLGAQIILSWTVPPLFAHGGDDLAALSISYDASARVPHGFLLHDPPVVLDAEEPSTARGLVRSPVNILRVYAKRAEAANSNDVTLATDQLARDDDGNELIEAGDFSMMSATVGDSTSDQTVARNIVAGAPVFARTVFTAARPFILGLRGNTTDNMVGTSVSFFATRSRTARATHDNDFWPLTIDPSPIRRARNPVQALRDQLPDAFETTEVPGHGFAVVFRHDRKLWLGWLTQDLSPIGNLQEIPVLGRTPGRPRVAADGNRVLIVFADHEVTPDGGSAPRYRLREASVEFGSHSPIVADNIAISIAGDMDDFAPFAAAMHDHSWVLSWTRGHADGAFSERGTVLLQSLDRELRPRGATVVMSDADGGSDARLLSLPEGLAMVAYAAGVGSPRKVAMSVARCTVRPAAVLATDAGTPDA